MVLGKADGGSQAWAENSDSAETILTVSGAALLRMCLTQHCSGLAIYLLKAEESCKKARDLYHLNI